MITLFEDMANLINRLFGQMSSMWVYQGLSLYMMIFYLMLFTVLMWFFKKLIQHSG